MDELRRTGTSSIISVCLTTSASSKDHLIDPDQPCTPWERRFMTPKQTKNCDRKRQTYGVVMDTAKKMMNAIENSPQRIQNVLDKMNEEIKDVEIMNDFVDSARLKVHEQQQELANDFIEPNMVILPKDPAPVPSSGRKRTARIKSSTETLKEARCALWTQV